MNLPNLTTAQEVIERLGGIKGVAEMTNSKYQRVWNWKSFGRFPARTYILMTNELRRRGYTAPTELWSMSEAEQPAEEQG